MFEILATRHGGPWQRTGIQLVSPISGVNKGIPRFFFE
jgi:hypothetical protein